MCRTLSVLVVCILFVPAPLHAALNMVLTEHLGGEQVSGVAVEGNLAFLAESGSFTVLDVTDPQSPLVLADVATPAPALAVDVANGIAYVAAGAGGVLIYDVTNPSSPQLIATHAFFAAKVKWQADRLYICGRTHGVRILDVSTPASPAVISTYTYSDPAVSFIDIDVSSDIAYVGAVDLAGPEYVNELHILNTATNPPQLLKLFYGGLGMGLRVGLGPYLYAIGGPDDPYGGGSQNYILDVSDPSNPVTVKTFSMSAVPQDVTYSDGFLYLFTGSGLQIFDVTTATSISLVSRVDYNAGGGGTLAEGRLYHACDDWGLTILGLDSPDHASILGKWDRFTQAARITRDGDILYICGERLWIMDVSDPADRHVIGSVDVAKPWACVLSDAHLYVVDLVRGLVTVDVTDLDAPVILDEKPGKAKDVRVRNGFLYVLEDGGLRVYDLSDPAHPAPRGFLGLSGAFVSLNGDYAYVSDPNTDLQIVDISNPDAPHGVRSRPIISFETEVMDGRLYAACGESGLQIYDVTNPISPHLLGSRIFGNTRGLDVTGTRVTLADSWQGVLVVETADPGNMVVLASHEVPVTVQPGDVVTRNNEIYSGAFYNGLFVYELIGAVPVGLLSFTAERRGSGAVIQWQVRDDTDHMGFHVYRQSSDGERVKLTPSTLSGQSRYAFVDATPPRQEAKYWLAQLSRSGDVTWYGPALLPAGVPVMEPVRASPNPARASISIEFSRSAPGRVAIDVFDLSGRLIRSAEAPYEAGRHSWQWNGRDQAGTRVPDGLYLFVVSSDEGARSGKVAIIR